MFVLKKNRRLFSKRGHSQPPSLEALPVVDISPFIRHGHPAENRQKVIQAVDNACRNYGFLYVIGHGVDPLLTQKALDVSREFFHQTNSEKESISIKNSPCYRGYQKLGLNITQQQPDWHEAIDFMSEWNAAHASQDNVWGPNQWPLNLVDFKPTIEMYINEMLRLGEILMRIFACALGLKPDFFEQYMDNPFWIFRSIGYPPIPKNRNTNVGTGCGVHTDYGCLTLVNQDLTGGLFVETTSGQWVHATPIPGSFVVNVGDMLSHWTNGLYKSTPHKVTNLSEDNFRVSVPFFYEPNYNAVITPLDLPGTPVSTFGSKPVVYGDHLYKKITNNFDY